MIASAVESDPVAGRGRKVLIVAIVLLAASTAASSRMATHFRHQVTELRSHPAAAATVSAIPSPVQRLSTSPIATAAAVSAPPTAGPTVSAPPLTTRAFDLEMSRPHVTVYLTAAAADGVGFTDGQLVVTALVRGAQPGVQYSLAGGDCDLNEADKVWAQGVADTTGTALLTGPTWTLPKADQYYLFFDSVPAGGTTPPVEGAGLEGVFLLSGLLNPRGPRSQPCV